VAWRGCNQHAIALPQVLGSPVAAFPGPTAGVANPLRFRSTLHYFGCFLGRFCSLNRVRIRHPRSHLQTARIQYHGHTACRLSDSPSRMAESSPVSFTSATVRSSLCAPFGAASSVQRTNAKPTSSRCIAPCAGRRRGLNDRTFEVTDEDPQNVGVDRRRIFLRRFCASVMSSPPRNSRLPDASCKT